MENKDKIDKVINAIAFIAIISFFIGAMIAIWLGFIGVKILLSAVVLFFGDFLVFLWLKLVDAEKQKGDKRHHESKNITRGANDKKTGSR